MRQWSTARGLRRLSDGARAGRLVPHGLTLARPVHSELLIRKSRFLGCVQPVAGRAEALAWSPRCAREHPGAAHVCWALLAGGQSAANDDGEPGGTAGRPMLEVLRHQELEGVLATVVRYFGGVKLGAGGLVRAYTDAVAQALLQAREAAAAAGCCSWRAACPMRWKAWCGASCRRAGAVLGRGAARRARWRSSSRVAEGLAADLAPALNEARRKAQLRLAGRAA